MSKAPGMAGILYAVATPIGNLEDITVRVLRILREEVSMVYCEDTRRTRKLLNHYGIGLPAQSLHAHSSDQRIAEAISRLLEGKSIAYLTDSGTPAISDPGSRLIAAAAEHEIETVPLPGPAALSTIVSVAGFPEKRIIFAGFLSKKDGRRRRELEELRQFRGIIILYESPHRIVRLLEAASGVFPEQKAVIAREMTKVHEEIIRGTVKELALKSDTITTKGEFTIAIWNKDNANEEESED